MGTLIRQRLGWLRPTGRARARREQRQERGAAARTGVCAPFEVPRGKRRMEHRREGVGWGEGGEAGAPRLVGGRVGGSGGREEAAVKTRDNLKWYLNR